EMTTSEGSGATPVGDRNAGDDPRATGPTLGFAGPKSLAYTVVGGADERGGAGGSSAAIVGAVALSRAIAASPQAQNGCMISPDPRQDRGRRCTRSRPRSVA